MLCYTVNVLVFHWSGHLFGVFFLPISESDIVGLHYRPQRSCGQGNVFTGVCLSTGGRVSASVHAGMPYPPDGEPNPPPRNGEPPQDGEPPPLGSRLQHTVYGGRYASYWNAFLLKRVLIHIITTRKRSFGQGNIFSSVCQEFCSWGGVPGQVHPPPGRCTPWAGSPPRAVHAGKYGQQAGGTHPTGMHSCIDVCKKF